jgi:hypothetical protein
VDDPGSAYRTRAQIARRPWWPIAVLVGGVTLVAHAILFAVVGSPWAPAGGSEPAVPPARALPGATTAPSPSASPTPLPGIVLLPVARPAGQQGAVFPTVIPMVAERDDPVGDPEYSECDERGSCAPIEPPADAAVPDITHLAAWIDDDALHVEVRLAGSLPAESDATPRWRVEVSIRRGGHLIDAPVCSAASCGSFFEIPMFTSSVTRGSNAWTVHWQIDLDEITAALDRDDTEWAEESQVLEVLGLASARWGTRSSSDSTADGQGGWLTVPGWSRSCPPGSDPDVPGPADQARPPTELISMAFDREARQIVLLGQSPESTTETWTFDVCTNRWTQRSASGAPERALLAYDRDSQVVVAFAPPAWGEDVDASVFKRATGRWEQRSAAPLQQLLGVAYEPRSGQIVVHGVSAETETPELWAYDVDHDAWARLRQIDPPDLGLDPQHELLAYDPTRARIVLHLIDRSWEYNPASGRWSTDRASSPPVNGGFFGVPGSIATDEASGRVVIYSGGQVLAYDGAAGRWETVETREPWPDWGVPGGRLGQSIVYDPLNRRFVVYGGWRIDPCVDPDDVWAFDPAASQWAPLLAQTVADLRVSGGTGQATPNPNQSPWVRAAMVTLHDGPFFTRVPGVADEPWSSTPPAAAASVVDGVLVPECQLWTDGTVWWEETTSDPAARAWIEIDLGGTFVLDQALVQADVNDEYLLSYRDPDTAAWRALWAVPLGDVGGMATRPAQGHPGVHWTLPRPVVADALRFEATSGDDQYSVSEIAVFGRPAP